MKMFTGKKMCMAAALLCMAAGLTSCHDDDDYLNITVRLNQTEIPYSEDGVWLGVEQNQPFQSQYMVFSHAGEVSPWGLVWSGFTPARIAATSLGEDGGEWFDNQFMVMTGGGMSGTGTPYIVSYWNTSENDDTPLESRSCHIYYSSHPDGEHYSFTPMSIYVTNTCYAYHTIMEGNAFAQPFTSADYLTLVAHGVHADGTESTANFHLAGADTTGELRVVDAWEQFSLSSLGEVTDIYFTMESSQRNAWGMTAPSYFAIDCLSFRAKLPGK